MKLMTLAVIQGMQIEIRATGADSPEALDVLVSLVKADFKET